MSTAATHALQLLPLLPFSLSIKHSHLQPPKIFGPLNLPPVTAWFWLNPCHKPFKCFLVWVSNLPHAPNTQLQSLQNTHTHTLSLFLKWKQNSWHRGFLTIYLLLALVNHSLKLTTQATEWRGLSAIKNSVPTSPLLSLLPVACLIPACYRICTLVLYCQTMKPPSHCLLFHLLLPFPTPPTLPFS